MKKTKPAASPSATATTDTDPPKTKAAKPAAKPPKKTPKQTPPTVAALVGDESAKTVAEAVREVAQELLAPTEEAPGIANFVPDYIRRDDAERFGNAFHAERLYSPAPHIIWVHTDHILEGTNQPRHEPAPDDEQFTELVESVGENGVQQAVLLRLAPKNHPVLSMHSEYVAGQYLELIFGEQRTRAMRRNYGKSANLKFKYIPARIVEADDKAAATMALQENTHRRELDALDVADQLGMMNNLLGMDTQELIAASKLTPGRFHSIYALRKAGPILRNAYQRGIVNMSRASRLARLPLDIQTEAVEAVEKVHPEGKISKAAFGVIMDKYSKELKGATWQLDDATMSDAQGALPACLACPYYSGNLGEETGQGQRPMCYAGDCFKRKLSVQASRAADDLVKLGHTLAESGDVLRYTNGIYWLGGALWLRDQDSFNIYCPTLPAFHLKSVTVEAVKPAANSPMTVFVHGGNITLAVDAGKAQEWARLAFGLDDLIEQQKQADQARREAELAEMADAQADDTEKPDEGELSLEAQLDLDRPAEAATLTNLAAPPEKPTGLPYTVGESPAPLPANTEPEPDELVTVSGSPGQAQKQIRGRDNLLKAAALGACEHAKTSDKNDAALITETVIIMAGLHVTDAHRQPPEFTRYLAHALGVPWPALDAPVSFKFRNALTNAIEAQPAEVKLCLLAPLVIAYGRSLRAVGPAAWEQDLESWLDRFGISLSALKAEHGGEKVLNVKP